MYYLHSLTVGMAMQSRRKRSRRDYVRGEIQRTVASLTMNRSSEAKTMLHLRPSTLTSSPRPRSSPGRDTAGTLMSLSLRLGKDNWVHFLTRQVHVRIVRFVPSVV